MRLICTTQFAYLLLLRIQCEIMLGCVETIIDVGPETDLIKNTLVSLVAEGEKCTASSRVNNGYTDTRRG
jgi:hypothetical protein